MAAHYGRTAPYQKQWIRKDGSLMWGLFAPTRLAGNGRESECVEFIVDITQTKEAEAALRASVAERGRCSGSCIIASRTTCR